MRRCRWAIAVGVCWILVVQLSSVSKIDFLHDRGMPKPRFTIASGLGVPSSSSSSSSFQVAFFFDPTPRVYDQSVAYCHSQGGVIASIHSAEEQADVERITEGVAYLGATSDGQGKWSWEDGTPFDYVHSFSDGIPGTRETRLVIRMDQYGKWNDWSTGGVRFGVVCRSVRLALQPIQTIQTVRLACHGLSRLHGAPAEGTIELLGANSLSGNSKRERVLVTGGAGYIGSHATAKLLEEGYAVIIVDNLSRGHLETVRILQGLACKLNAELAFVVADVGRSELMHRLLQATQPQSVIHFAAVAFVGESMANPLLYFRNITENTITLLSAMERANVAKIIYSSSCTTYGDQPASEMPITENTTQNPMNVYGRAKMMAEQVIFNWVWRRPKVCATVLRYFNVIGADPLGRLGEVPRVRGDALDSRISGALFDAASGRIKSFRVLGDDFPTKDGTAERDYIHVSDLVDAHLLLLKRQRPPDESPPPQDRATECGAQLYNVGLGRPNSVREFLRVGKNLTGALPFAVEVLPRRPGDPASVYAKPDKLMALGWKPRFTNLREALEHEWNFRLAHPGLFPGQRVKGS